jgi:hypothetical protein
MASSGGRKHVRKCETGFMPVPWSMSRNKALGIRKIANKPKDDEAVGPISKHCGSYHGLFCTTLWVCCAQELFGFSIGYLNAPTSAVPFNDLR